MVMPFTTCGTFDFRQQSSERDWADIQITALHLALSLYRLHSLGFCHTDLHDGNVLIYEDHQAELMDVGFSVSVEEAHKSPGVYGRLDYMPPELFTGVSARTQKSDVYCFGTLLWQLVTGLPPKGIALNEIKAHPEGMREDLIPGAPMQFSQILKACWHPDPTHRPSMKLVAERLDRWGSKMKSAETSPSRMRYPFAPETHQFIMERQAVHRRQMNQDSLGNMYNFATDENLISTMPLSTRSQFHFEEVLGQMAQRADVLPFAMNQNSGKCLLIVLYYSHHSL